MVRFFNWIKRVYEGWKNVILGINTEQYQKRYDICMSCDKKIRLTKTITFVQCVVVNLKQNLDLKMKYVI